MRAESDTHGRQSHLPFPRKGTETRKPSRKPRFPKDGHTYLFPARGRKPKNDGLLLVWLLISHTYLFPARGRKLIEDKSQSGTLDRSHLPFPRKGTETWVAGGDHPHTGIGICVTPTFSPQGDGNFSFLETYFFVTLGHTYLFPARGRKLRSSLCIPR